jgi:S-adenosylmethionine synthetase
MPVPAFLANDLARKLSEVRLAGRLPALYPDGKVQVSVRYKNEKPVGIATVVVSAHHHADADLAKLRRDLKRLVIKPFLDPTGLMDEDTEVLINPVGAFSEGGPRADAGLTGRKQTVDCYGPACGHGGSAFSGKDPTKPDRSGSYGARWAAKNVVAAGLARRCSVEISYVIGMPDPLSVTVDTFGTGKLSDEKLGAILAEEFDFSPAGIIESLDLRRPIYSDTAVFGHFGRPDVAFSWERLDRVADLKKHLPRKKTTRKKGAK